MSTSIFDYEVKNTGQTFFQTFMAGHTGHMRHLPGLFIAQAFLDPADLFLEFAETLLVPSDLPAADMSSRISQIEAYRLLEVFKIALQTFQRHFEFSPAH